MKKIPTSERLKEIMHEKGLKQIEVVRLAKPLCEKYNVRLGRNDMSQYVAGKVEPGQYKLYILAKTLNVSEAWLMGLEVPKERCEEKVSTLQQKISSISEYNPNVHKIPILGTIAAGLPIYAEQHIEDYTYTDHNHGAEYFALRVKGDSMNATAIIDGSILIVRRQEEVENGEIAVVMVNEDDATVKRFKKDGNTVQLIPQSYNPEHQIQFYNLKKDTIKIIGKVIECKIEF